ncbi:MAG TPA: glycerophosphodiester phosphodiesterase family protein [Candidatus Saccharimonadales bacterium]|nr:glycerophosphodiester phosphodiesterase family protein [Candidatus Saccharimonadales bacterium]
MKIIGHRGAAGLALENTLPSLELARLLGVDAIEFDIRKTKDNRLVLCHDSDLSRISNNAAKLSDLTLQELQLITLNDEQSHVPSLEEALQMVGPSPVIIEIKQRGCAQELIAVLERFPKLDFTVVSFMLDELTDLRDRRPELRLVGLERTKPFDIIHFAKQRKLNGVGLNFWLLNPLTYWLIRRAGLSLYVYTVNNRLLGNFIRILYPQTAICTDHPEWFIKHPWLRLRQNGVGKPSRLHIKPPKAAKSGKL